MDREHYKKTYQELVDELGPEGAQKIVDNYIRLSELYRTTPTFVVHNCKLLTTYKPQAS